MYNFLIELVSIKEMVVNNVNKEAISSAIENINFENFKLMELCSAAIFWQPLSRPLKISYSYYNRDNFFSFCWHLMKITEF